MRFQATAENWQRWCGRDMAWEIVQVRVAATGKARSPTVDSRVRRTDSDDVDAERRRVLVSESADWRSSSARYDGPVPWRCQNSNIDIVIVAIESRMIH